MSFPEMGVTCTAGGGEGSTAADEGDDKDGDADDYGLLLAK